jgi:hypothetical protein
VELDGRQAVIDGKFHVLSHPGITNDTALRFEKGCFRAPIRSILPVLVFWFLLGSLMKTDANLLDQRGNRQVFIQFRPMDSVAGRLDLHVSALRHAGSCKERGTGFPGNLVDLSIHFHLQEVGSGIKTADIVNFFIHLVHLFEQRGIQKQGSRNFRK